MIYEDTRYTYTFGDLIEKLGENKLLGDYPIFNEDYRATLNKNIINTYYTREIAFGSVSKFIFHFKARLNKIMPRYNMLFKIKKTDFNALYNVDLTETFEHEITSNSSETSNSNIDSNSETTNKGKIKSDNTAKNIASQYPNKNMLMSDDINSFEYVSGMTQNNSNATSENNDSSTGNSNTITSSDAEGNNNTIERYTKKTLGSSAGLPFSKALEQFKDFAKSYDLDAQICKELSDLFFGLY